MPADLPQQLDDITPSKKQGGTVTLTAHGWAIHRYTMGFLLGLLAVIGGVFVHDYLTWRETVNLLKSERNGTLYSHEARLTRLEESDARIMSHLSRSATEQQRQGEILSELRSDVRVLMSRGQ